MQMEVDHRLKSVEQTTEDNQDQSQLDGQDNSKAEIIESTSEDIQEQSQDKKSSWKDAAKGCAVISSIVFIVLAITYGFQKKMPPVTEFILTGVTWTIGIIFILLFFTIIVKIFKAFFEICKPAEELFKLLIEYIKKLFVFIFSIGILAVIIGIGVKIGGFVGGVIAFLFLIALGWWGDRKSKSKTMNYASEAEQKIEDKKN